MITKNEKEKGDVKARVSDDPTKINQKSQKKGGGGEKHVRICACFHRFHLDKCAQRLAVVAPEELIQKKLV